MVFGIRDHDGSEKHWFQVAPAINISGAKAIRNAMQGMIDTCSGSFDKMRGGALMATGLTAMFDNGEVSDTVEVRAGNRVVECYSECVVKDRFAQ